MNKNIKMLIGGAFLYEAIDISMVYILNIDGAHVFMIGIMALLGSAAFVIDTLMTCDKKDKEREAKKKKEQSNKKKDSADKKEKTEAEE